MIHYQFEIEITFRTQLSVIATIRYPSNKFNYNLILLRILIKYQSVNQAIDCETRFIVFAHTN